MSWVDSFKNTIGENTIKNPLFDILPKKDSKGKPIVQGGGKEKQPLKKESDWAKNLKAKTNLALGESKVIVGIIAILVILILVKRK